MTKHGGTIWPPLESAYTDELGPIDPEVYQAAGAIWTRWGGRFALRTLKDEPAGLQLMLKAVANVSRRAAQGAPLITNLNSYLSLTYKRLVLAKLEEDSGHRQRERAVADELPLTDSIVADVERKILVQQIIRRMDRWMREVFELLTLGYTFEEIGQSLGMASNVVRSKYQKNLMRLKKQLEGETEEGR